MRWVLLLLLSVSTASRRDSLASAIFCAVPGTCLRESRPPLRVMASQQMLRH